VGAIIFQHANLITGNFLNNFELTALKLLIRSKNMIFVIMFVKK